MTTTHRQLLLTENHPNAKQPTVSAVLEIGEGLPRRERMGGLVLVGAGNWGRKLASEALALKLLVGFVDLDDERLRAAHEALGSPPNVQTHSTLAAALDAHGDAAVIVATPPATHYAVAREALEAGRDVWVEKPICSAVDDAEALVVLAAERQRVLFVDHLLHYSYPHRAALDLAASGWVGAVTRVRAIRQNFGTVRTVENALLSLSPHDVSLVTALCGGVPSTVLSEGQRCVGPPGAPEDYVDVFLEYRKARAHITASWWHYEKERRLTIYGEKGCIVVNETPREGRPQLEGYMWTSKRSGDGTRVTIEKSKIDVSKELQKLRGAAPGDEATRSPVRVALMAFVDACKRREKPRTDGNEGLNVLRVLNAAQQSLVTKKRVTLGEKSSTASDQVGEKQAAEANGRAGVAAAAGSGATADVEMEDDAQPAASSSAAAKTSESQTPTVKREVANAAPEEPGATKAEPNYYAHPLAVIDDGATIGANTKIWHFTHVMRGARIGARCSLGQNCYVGGGAVLGDGVRVQNGVSIWDGVTVEDDAFLGPHCVFTNVRMPRADFPVNGKYEATRVCRGATIGANATVVCGATLGERAFVGAGAVVTRSVPAYALAYGNPARVMGWVSHAGAKLTVIAKLPQGRRAMQCSVTGAAYEWRPPASPELDPSVVRTL